MPKFTVTNSDVAHKAVRAANVGDAARTLARTLLERRKITKLKRLDGGIDWATYRAEEASGRAVEFKVVRVEE